MAATAPTRPHGGLLEIVFAFDTTGSMSSVLEEVQGRLQDMLQRLQADIPGIRIGVIARGNFFDKNRLTKELDLSTNVEELCSFVKCVKGIDVGDGHECYELILRKVLENFSWTCGSEKILIMIGDANPHEPNFDLNVDNNNWRTEIDCFYNKGVKIYGVQVLNHKGVEDFYKTMSTNTGGHYLKLSEVSNICDFLLAICYREWSKDIFYDYEAKVRGHYGPDGIHKDIEDLFRTLKRKGSLRRCRPAIPGDIPIAGTGSTSLLHCPPSPGYLSPSPAYNIASPGYVPPSPAYNISSPGYLPPSPANSESSPGYVPPSPAYSESSPGYLAPFPAYSESSPGYLPPSPAYSESSPCYVPLSPTYSEPLPGYFPSSPASSGYFTPSSPLSPTYSPPSSDYLSLSSPAYSSSPWVFSPFYSPSSGYLSLSSPSYSSLSSLSSPSYSPPSSVDALPFPPYNPVLPVYPPILSTENSFPV